MTKHHALAWMTLLLIIVTVLGSRLLNADLLFTDEYLSMRNAGLVDGPLTYDGVLERTINEDLGGMGVLYHFELKAWGDAIGATPYSVRAFSLLWGLVAVAALYRLGADMFGRRAGLYAAVLLGFSAFFIDYLHEARAYTQFVALTIIVIGLYWRIQHGARVGTGGYVALALAIGWLVYTHYVALSIGVVLSVFHLLNFQAVRRWWLTVAAMAVGGLLFVPWLGFTIQVAQRGAGEITRHNTSMSTSEWVPSFFATAANANTAMLLLLGYFLIVSLRWTSWRRMLASPVFLVACWLIIAGGLIVVINARIPFMVHLRYTIFLFPALALLGALGIRSAAQRGLPAGALLAVIAVVGAGQSFNPHFVGDLFGQVYRAPAAGMYQALDRVRARANAEQDALLIHIAQPGFEPFQLFPNGYLFLDMPVKRAEQFELMNMSLKGDDNGYLNDALPVFDGIRAVWTAIVPEVPTTNRSGVVNYILNSQFAECGVLLQRHDVRLNLYLRPADNEIPSAAISSDEAGTVILYEPRLHLTDTVEVALLWDVDSLPRGQYSYSLRLLNAAGEPVASTDVGIPDERPQACTVSQLAWDGLPSGQYQLVVYVYNWQTLAPLNAEPILLETLQR